MKQLYSSRFYTRIRLLVVRIQPCPCVCGLTEPLPVGLDLWSQAAHFPLELLLGFFKQLAVLGDDFSFRLCRLDLWTHTKITWDVTQPSAPIGTITDNSAQVALSTGEKESSVLW